MSINRKRTNLRVRITLAILMVTSIGCTLLAFGVYLSNEGLEDVVLERQVRDEFHTLVRLSHRTPHVARVESALVKGYVGQDNPDLPRQLAALQPGDYHSVPINDRRYQILVAEDDGERFYISYDITEWEIREREMILILVLGVLIVAAAAIWVGSWASQQIVAPVTRLAERVTQLQPDERKVRIAGEFEGAEVSDIAEAFDRFMLRLDGFVAREQSFTSAASHELRTPLAVMQGAADVLQEQPELGEVSARAVRRIQRASREMLEFIEALLFLAREPEKLTAGKEHCEINAIAAQLVEDFRTLHETESVSITFSADQPLIQNVAPSLPTMVISNLLRNAIEHTSSGEISLQLVGTRLTIQDSGSGIKPEDQKRVFDRNFSTKKSGNGMGLPIAKRICDQCGWDIMIDSTPGRGTTVTLQFPQPGAEVQSTTVV